MRVPEIPWRALDADLRAFVGRRVHNQADVDDLVQRVLLRIVMGRGSLREIERLHAWIYRVARNVIADYYRSPMVRRERASGSPFELASASDESIASMPVEDDDRSALRELAACLQPMLRQLLPAYQEAIRMVDLDGLTQAEASRRAGLTVSGMKSRVQRARLQLRAMVEKCCRVDLDRRGAITSFASRRSEHCGCGGCK